MDAYDQRESLHLDAPGSLKSISLTCPASLFLSGQLLDRERTRKRTGGEQERQGDLDITHSSFSHQLLDSKKARTRKESLVLLRAPFDGKEGKRLRLERSSSEQARAHGKSGE